MKFLILTINLTFELSAATQAARSSFVHVNYIPPISAAIYRVVSEKFISVRIIKFYSRKDVSLQ